MSASLQRLNLAPAELRAIERDNVRKIFPTRQRETHASNFIWSSQLAVTSNADACDPGLGSVGHFGTVGKTWVSRYEGAPW